MYLQTLSRIGIDSKVDFRATTSLPVALATMLFLLPIVISNFVVGNKLAGSGSLFIVLLFAVNVWLIRRGHNNQSFILFLLIPAGTIHINLAYPEDGFIALVSFSPAIVAVYCMLSERRAWLANICILAASLPLSLTLQQPIYSVRITIALLAISVFTAIVVRVVDSLNAELHVQLVRDPMTGLLNRVKLKSILEKAIDQYEADGFVATVLTLDIDHFKSINDRYGHDVGDIALTAVAKILKRHLPVSDFAFRTGGEEFLVLLNNTNEKGGYLLAEYFRHEVELAEIVKDRVITVSIGVAELKAGESYTQWLKRADNNMYTAKKLGRNRVSTVALPSNSNLSDTNIQHTAVN